MPVEIALLFGAIISATDPISVLAIFKDLRMDKRLSLIVEGESLLSAVTSEIRPDWDLSTPGLREAWNAGDFSRFHGWDKHASMEVKK